MRVLIAPDSFKGSLSAAQAAFSIAEGVRAVFTEAECDLLPVADGGEGTLEALVAATGGSFFTREVQDPLGRPVAAKWGLLGDQVTAVVEMAVASGLTLLAPAERNPLLTSSFGAGQLIREALSVLHSGKPRNFNGRLKLIVGIGGSATNDGGVGALSALGAKFLDRRNRPLPPGGQALAGLARIDLSNFDQLVGRTDVLVACDVDNPLTGPSGASMVFGPQKGADPAMAASLDAALSHYASVARRATGRDAAEIPGAGAAGGIGAAFLFFTDARLRPGIDIVLEALDFDRRAAKADLIITGEGLTDAQTARGKAPAGVARAAKKIGRPVVCISGALGEGADMVYESGIDVLAASVCSPRALSYWLENAADGLRAASIRVCRALKAGRDLGACDSGVRTPGGGFE